MTVQARRLSGLAVAVLVGCSNGGSSGPAGEGGTGADTAAPDSAGGGSSGAGGMADGASPAEGGGDAAPEGAPPGDGASEAATLEAGAGCVDGGPAQQCGAPTVCGPIVHPTIFSGAAPNPTGGTIAPGTYVLTAFNIYGYQGSGAPTTVQVAETYAPGQFVESSYVNGLEQSPIGGSYTVSGATLTRNRTCPNAFTEVDGYTATTTTLTRFRSFPSDAGTEVHVEIETRQ